MGCGWLWSIVRVLSARPMQEERRLGPLHATRPMSKQNNTRRPGLLGGTSPRWFEQ